MVRSDHARAKPRSRSRRRSPQSSGLGACHLARRKASIAAARTPQASQSSVDSDEAGMGVGRAIDGRTPVRITVSTILFDGSGSPTFGPNPIRTVCAEGDSA